MLDSLRETLVTMTFQPACSPTWIMPYQPPRYCILSSTVLHRWSGIENASCLTQDPAKPRQDAHVRNEDGSYPQRVCIDIDARHLSNVGSPLSPLTKTPARCGQRNRDIEPSSDSRWFLILVDR
ncbi:uncharacterized protein UV8b_06195 [Ustilaginoidea virens]|uniref:Uncharacterized protein n=1 Tax=Ustilaginoidea virens TaxID=1159556 RepID=A0A8E5HUT3_USTVR|nr:uncharacterized protein UV8b_06195 [Ustilaginoidea virens]QUC21954.1 hypothetical protein UV8b_06195 [Ustilaginoidea virens]